MTGWLTKSLRTILKHRSMASSRAMHVALSLFSVVMVLQYPAPPVWAQAMPESAPASSAPAADAAIDPFLIKNVPVDVTAATVTEARDRGMTQGRVAAFRRMVERMTMREAMAGLSMPNATQIVDMVQEFSVANERSSAVRYLADLTVRFDPNAVRAFLRGQNMAFAEIASRPLLVLPVLSEDPAVAALLWQDASPWRAAWEKAATHDGLVPLTLPLGDLEDIGMLSIDQLIAKDTGALTQLAAKYGAAGVIIVRAEIAPESPQQLSVTLSELRPIGAPWDGQFNVQLSDNRPREESYAAAASEAVRAIEDGWKQRNVLRFGEGGRITALIPVTSLQDWLGIKARLVRVPVVERVDLQAMSKSLVQAEIAFAGDSTQLQFAMGQHDLELSQDGDMWMLRTPKPQNPPGAEQTSPPAADQPGQQ
ncbi:MAG: DUF2066 domain-containing protein [Rhodospirillaceae bacterium]|nr:DUF2066 domain-containing protein [Rhodospirillaceae bacterium]